jgi:hypothetical protein
MQRNTAAISVPVILTSTDKLYFICEARLANAAFVMFFYLCKIVTTRASPLGIPRDIYRGRTQIRVKM